MSHCMTGLQCNQTPLGGCIWMVSCPLSGVAVCSPSPGHLSAPKSPAQFSAQRKEARDRGFTDPPLLRPSGLAQTSSHDHTFGAIFLHLSIPDISCLPLWSSVHTCTHTHRNMLTSSQACTQYHTQCARPTVQVRSGS